MRCAYHLSYPSPIQNCEFDGWLYIFSLCHHGLTLIIRPLFLAYALEIFTSRAEQCEYEWEIKSFCQRTWRTQCALTKMCTVVSALNNICGCVFSNFHRYKDEISLILWIIKLCPTILLDKTCFSVGFCMQQKSKNAPLEKEERYNY